MELDEFVGDECFFVSDDDVNVDVNVIPLWADDRREFPRDDEVTPDGDDDVDDSDS